MSSLDQSDRFLTKFLLILSSDPYAMNDTFNKSFGQNDKQRYEIWRIFTMSSVKRIFAIEELSDIPFDTINNLLKGKSIRTGGG